MDSFSFARGDFPEGLILGTPTSAYQIEGQANGRAGTNHSDSYSATPGNLVRG